MGRPSAFNQQLADGICAGIAVGESLRSILDDEGMPCRSTVFLWLDRNGGFRAQYTAARQKQTVLLQEQVQRREIAMPDAPEHTREFRRAKKRLQDLKRRAGQLAPKKYRPAAAQASAF